MYVRINKLASILKALCTCKRSEQINRDSFSGNHFFPVEETLWRQNLSGAGSKVWLGKIKCIFIIIYLRNRLVTRFYSTLYFKETYAVDFQYCGCLDELKITQIFNSLSWVTISGLKITKSRLTKLFYYDLKRAITNKQTNKSQWASINFQELI